MEAIPRNYDECRFDAFCKSVLRNEAHNYRRGLKRQRDRQVSISALSQADMDKLSTVDHYPSDSYTFSLHGYDCTSTTSLWPMPLPACPHRRKAF